MKKLLLGALALLSLAGCDGPTGADQYKFETKEYTQTLFTTVVVEHPNLGDLQRAYKALPSKPDIEAGRELQAFSVIRRVNGNETCIVHIVDPSVNYAPEFIGHEFVHCIYGRFHPTQ